MSNLRENDSFTAWTHAELLNRVFCTDYKRWMSSVWNVDDDTIVWMVRFDGKIRDGWRNRILSDDSLCQENVYGKKMWKGVPVDDSQQLRLVFAITEDDYCRKYVFKGVYKYDPNGSDPKGREYFKKQSSEFCLS